MMWVAPAPTSVTGFQVAVILVLPPVPVSPVGAAGVARVAIGWNQGAGGEVPRAPSAARAVTRTR